MTDEQIIKALECHANPDLATCEECPLLNMQDCAYKLSKYALDLINRQKAEIEHLKSATNCYRAYEEEQKAEAVNEFAERLHCHCQSIINEEWNKKVYPTSWADAYEEFDDVVDNLVKEMVGEG